MSQEKELGNVFTAGTLGIPVSGDIKRSSINIPSNEDYCMLGVCRTFSEGVLSFVKLWDTAAENDKTIFHAIAIGYDSNDDFSAGDIIPIYRTGDFQNYGTEGYELHTESPTKTSFVCFPQKPTNAILIVDNGNGAGTPVGGGDTLSLVPIDSIENFYNTPNIWKEGRQYLGIKIIPTQPGTNPYYIIDLHGYGDVAETLSETAGNFTFEIDLDVQGKMRDFRVTENE